MVWPLETSHAQHLETLPVISIIVKKSKTLPTVLPSGEWNIYGIILNSKELNCPLSLIPLLLWPILIMLDP